MDAAGDEETSVSIFSLLPNELIQRILEISLFSDYSLQTCLSLCLVASWTRRMALPHLFSTIVLTDGANPLISKADTELGFRFDPGARTELVRNVWCRGP